MAMIRCPECAATVSDRAKACVNCGFPLEKHLDEQVQIDAAQKFATRLGPNPDFSIGKQVANWGGNAAIKLDADFVFGQLRSLEPGVVEILRYKSGIQLMNSIWRSGSGVDISFRQIVEIKQTPAEEVVREKKSVIGRGIVGGVLLGGAAAVVGALSALDNSKLKKLMVTELYFYDRASQRIKGIAFRGDRLPSKAFFDKVNAEKRAVVR